MRMLHALAPNKSWVLDGVEQKPLEGTNLVYTFDDAKAPTQHTTQYFELVGKGDALRRELLNDPVIIIDCEPTF
jgi:arylsulfatase A-like enzyme